MEVETDAGPFFVCEESHPSESHVGTVWHCGQTEHPSGVLLLSGEETKVQVEEAL